MEQQENVPKCVGIIMDGNRRWAKNNGLSTSEGHKKGYEVLKNFALWAEEAGISSVVAYAFSTENWKRAEGEVGYLMNLLALGLDEVLEEAEKKNRRISIIGEISDLSPVLQKRVKEVEEKTGDNTGFHLFLAISYGGRAEIVNAVNKAVKEGREIDEESFKDLLWTRELPDPDIILRTSGEKRLSGFVTWGSVYSELYFIDKHWPEFTKEDFTLLLEEYKKRDRRHGK